MNPLKSTTPATRRVPRVAFFMLVSIFAGGNCAEINGVGGLGSALLQGIIGQASLSFSLSLGVTGHAGGAGMVARNAANGDSLTGITQNGTFAFPIALSMGDAYDVQITTQPAGQVCSLSGGAGTVSNAAVTVSIACPGTHDIGGRVSGFTSGTDLVLRETVSGLTQNISAGSGGYTFSTSLLNGASYNVIVQSQPTGPAATCSLVNAAGTLAGANVTNINAACVVGTGVGGTILTPPVFTTNTLTTFAGDAPGSGPTQGTTDGVGNAARFSFPQAVASDGTNLFVLDEGSDSLRKVVIATGAVTTLWTDGSKSPEFLTTDGNYVYMVDRHSITRVEIATGTWSLLAGSLATSGYLDATGAAARFDRPGGITTDGTNLYVSDRNNNRVRKVTIAGGVVTTLAGDGTTGVLNLGVGPVGITTEGTFLYIADPGNARIRKIRISDGAFIDNIAAANVGGITTDGTNLYISTGAHTVLKYNALIAGGSFTTLVGTLGAGFTDGAPGTGRVNNPFDVTTDGNALFISDVNNHAIRRYK